MSVNYKAIADACTAGGYTNFETAFAALAAETTTALKPEARYNRRMILRELGFNDGRLIVGRLMDTIDADPTLTADDKAYLKGETNDDGLDLAHADTQHALTEWGDSVLPLTATDATVLLGLASETVPKWQGLKPGHVQNAMQWRSEGKV